MPETFPKILFDRFEIIDTLKKDQHTSVYLANHIYLGKRIILKTLSTDEIPDKTFLERFKREAKILAHLDHKNIIKVLDFGTTGNLFYISFEYFEGKNLRTIIKNNSLSNEEKIGLSIQLFNALNVAHQNGIIHRDIKPENILVNPKLELKIADFGLALGRDENFLTHKSSIVGTPGYMSPEQIRGEELTPQTDLFSSGIVIYELFTGINPFIGKDVGETINNILNFKVERELELISSLPGDIQELLNNLLRKNFSKRTKTALEALNFFTVQIEEKKEIIEEPEKKKRGKTIYYWVSALIFIAVIFFIYKNYFSVGNTLILDDTKKIKPLEKELNDSLENINRDTVITNNNLITTDVEEPFEETQIPVTTITYGKLFVEVNPWAEVFINDKKIGTTPLRDEIRLESGEYELKLVHEDFPVYTETIEIKQDELKTIRINFNEMVGFLDCKIYPWGEIFINDTYNSTSPLRKPIVLLPGHYNLIIRNPKYQDIKEEITIKAKVTITLRYNFDNRNE